MTGLSFEDRCEVSEYLRRIFEDPPQTSDIPGDNLEAADGESCQSHSWCSVASHTLARRCCVGEFKFKNLEESKQALLFLFSKIWVGLFVFLEQPQEAQSPLLTRLWDDLSFV
jgi:hypothetical protein